MDNPPINASHVMTAGGITAMLTQVYIYLTHWPLQPMNENVGSAFAGLTLVLFGLALSRRKKQSPSSTDRSGESAKS